jgi:microsomal dipeptidase-like Zn-dependent dipeptidase
MYCAVKNLDTSIAFIIVAHDRVSTLVEHQRRETSNSAGCIGRSDGVAGFISIIYVGR